VNAHVKNIYRKLHVRSRAQAVSCAKTWGLL
jgi:ATP/maltotriose-dependent transcriptional regulator MalT